MRVISLFAGIGGFDLAFERAGCTPVAQVEIDPQARAVLAEHWPQVRQHDDIRTFHARHGEADIVVGGFPCQDLGVAGKRAGFGGERSVLFFEMARIIHECQPAYVVWENVPGLLSANNGRDFASVLMALGEIGYHGAWTMLDAQWFGVPQRRQRIFGVFARGDSGAGRAAEILSFAARLRGDSAPGGEAGETIADALAAGAGGSKFGSGRQGQDTLIASPLGAHHGRLDLDNDTYVFESRFARNGRGAPSDIVPPLKAQSGGTGKGDAAPLVAFTERGRQNGRRLEYQENVAYALTNPGDGGRTQSRMLAGERAGGVRRLTPTECERLQGFPDGWTAGQSDSARYRMLGNAVAVPVVEWIARRIASHNDLLSAGTEAGNE